MKIADDEYVLWSTYSDEPVSPVVGRFEAVEWWGEDRVEWVDEHLCSCRARLGENTVKRNGQYVSVGGGRLAYHFDDYAAVLAYMVGGERPVKTEAHLRELADGFA
jgi:hypothetical protein